MMIKNYRQYMEFFPDMVSMDKFAAINVIHNSHMWYFSSTIREVVIQYNYGKEILAHFGSI
jgi:hypothetical protein